MANLFKYSGPRNAAGTLSPADGLPPGDGHQVDFGRLLGGVNARPTPAPNAVNLSTPTFKAIDSTLALVSTNSAGEQANYGSYQIAFAPGGPSIAFTSEGRNLVAGDNNNCFDIFVKNLATGAVTRVSTNAAGVEGNNASTTAVFLPGGDKIAFISAASNLVAGDTNNLPDIFIKDLASGAITRVSTMSDGSQFTVGESFSTLGIGTPTFSPDGTKMAFVFSNAGAYIYIKDLVTGTLTLVGSEVSGGADLPGPQFSPDGSKLLYRLHDSATSISGIYLKDLASGVVTLVSTNSAGQAANFHSEHARFSADGTRIVFASYASNLVAGDTNGNSDIFVKDLVTGAVTAVSINAAGVLAGGYRPVISPDGTLVAFTAGTLMVPNDGNSFGDIVLKNLLTGEAFLLAMKEDGRQSPTGSENAVFSPDGTQVGFYSDQLGSPDTTGYHDLYVSTLTPSPHYVEGGPPAQVAPAVKVLDPGSPNYNNGSLTVAITAGSVAGDMLSLALSNAPGASLAISGNQVLVNGIMVGTIVSSATSLAISFNANATNAVVELLTEAVCISSTSDNPTAATRSITFTLVDGGGTADGAVDTASFTRKMAFVPVDNQQILGTAGDDVLVGGAGRDTLDGGAGADQMSGGGGDDLYFVDNVGDKVVEAANQGFDIVYASTGYTLAQNSFVETLSTADWAGTTPFALGGNELANTLYGNAGHNVLDGGGGADTLNGLGGDDVYILDNAADAVVEAAGGGYDTIFTAVSYALAAGVSAEVLSVIDWTATGAMNLTGNALANRLYGNAGANVLTGGEGDDVLWGLGGGDTLIGGVGDDVYWIYALDDGITEVGGNGYDTAYLFTSYALGADANVEVVSTFNWLGFEAINLTANGMSNTVYGNAGVNTLNGGAGADLLVGLGGADTFAFTTALGGGNVDTIADFVHGTDKVALDDAIFTQIGALGALNANAFVIGSAAGDADDRIVYNSSTGALFYDADGNGVGAAVQFATLAPGLALTASDFAII